MSNSGKMVTVFCASRPQGVHEWYYLDIARTFGRRLAEEGFDCANGGGGGMMEALCQGAHGAGGYVHCVSLSAYPPRHTAYTEHEHYAPLFERQMRLIALADAIVGLPGGIGTLHEITEVLSRMSIDEIPKTMPFICVGDEWSHLQMLLKHQRAVGLMAFDPFELLTFVRDPEDAIAILKERLRPD